MADCQDREAELFMHHKDGHRIPILARTSPLRDLNGRVVGGVELFTDLTHLLAHNSRIQELERLALLDNLTQLANRNYLEREFLVRFEEMKRYGVCFGMLFIDIDHFKIINDTYGHDAGDMVLKFLANTLIANARSFDLFGRWGGEEFIGIIRNIDADGLVFLGNRIRMLIEHSYVIHNDSKLSVNVSIGATIAGQDDTIASIIKRADFLLYESKRLGRNRLTFG
jgi:diguanylate cyclase (GGDEF)-like protein